MSSKHSSKNHPDDSEQPAESSVSLAAVGVAIVGLAGVALAFLLTDDPAELASPVPTRTIGDTWDMALEAPVTFDAAQHYVKGAVDGAVEIIVFSDFECPYCKDTSGEMDTLLERYPNDVRIVFRNYPLDQSCNDNMQQQGHLNACKAALMGRCAGAQDLFWEMHDAIYALPLVTAAALDEIPEAIGISQDAFAECIGSETPLQDVRADIDEGQALGLTGTPAIFVNRRRMESLRAAPLSMLVDHIVAQSGAN